MKWGCEGNSGRFDISTELSVFHCFPLFKWKEKKLTDFNNTKEIEDYFLEIMKKYQLRHSNNDFIRKGPCFSHILN